MGWTDLDPAEGTEDMLLRLVYTPEQVLNWMADEGLADWVSVEDVSGDV